ncbi:MAG TPA: alginate lyase family protein [Acidimicrobiales bacterium]|nr:alginate lyase family protein [Acidimicrobiales bacterium]
MARITWYVQRLRKMSASEVAWRAQQHILKAAWSLPALRPKPSAPAGERQFRALLPAGWLLQFPPGARSSVLGVAEELMNGRYEILGHWRSDMAHPDWALDPVTGKRAPLSPYCFGIDHRDPALTGNVKQVWELSRLHHLTVLSLAYALSGEERFAERTAAQLSSWWRANPWLSGTNWTSGIEVGVRLISLTWTRRLLDGWEGAPVLFEHNDEAVAQIWAHQRYLAALPSRGSSANNHAVAEAAGLLVAALAFPWWEQSERWARHAARWLEDELAHNTFPSGVNREMAFDYHGLVTELAVVAGAEADAAGHPLSDVTWDRVAAMTDVIAATADVRLQPPRYGDSDDGKALVLDPSASRWAALLDSGRNVMGAPEWWPALDPSAFGCLVGALAAKHPVNERPLRPPSHFADAGLAIMRGKTADGSEVWCRCDSGPHGFLSIAAHAHADALSVEMRHEGVEILADPGTYCYHDEPKWRAYFRSTLGHNTLQLADRDQSMVGGPFLWRSHPRTSLTSWADGDDGEAIWSAEHDGYTSLEPPATHRRTVRLEKEASEPSIRAVAVVDQVESAQQYPVRLTYHFGPAVEADLEGHQVSLRWDGRTGPQEATLVLPEELTWRLMRGETAPVFGWYSPRFGVKQPAWAVVGSGRLNGLMTLRSEVRFAARSVRPRSAGRNGKTLSDTGEEMEDA